MKDRPGVSADEVFGSYERRPPVHHCRTGLFSVVSIYPMTWLWRREYGAKMLIRAAV
jgi:hypothetical protein